MTLAPGVLNFSNHTGSHASDNAKHKCSEHLGNQYVYFCLSCNFILIKKIAINPFVSNVRKYILLNIKTLGLQKTMYRFQNI